MRLHRAAQRSHTGLNTALSTLNELAAGAALHPDRFEVVEPGEQARNEPHLPHEWQQ